MSYFVYKGMVLPLIVEQDLGEVAFFFVSTCNMEWK